MAMIDVDEDAKVLNSDLKYIENEDIDAVRYKNGKVIILSTKDGKAHERVYDTCNDWLTQNTYKITRGRDDLASIGSIYASAFSGVLAALSGNPLLLAPLASLVSIPFYIPKARRRGKYNTKVEEFKESNLKEAYDIISKEMQGISVYLGGIEEVERKTGRKLEPVDIGKPKKFIEVYDDEFWLRAEASGLGADAIVNFQTGSPMRGTPVKFVDSK